MVILDDTTSEIYLRAAGGKRIDGDGDGGIERSDRTQGRVLRTVQRSGEPFLADAEGGRESGSALDASGTGAARVGVQMIPAYSPRVRGRSERNFFRGRLREGCLHVRVSELLDARRKIAAWCRVQRGASAQQLGYRTPKEFAGVQAAGSYATQRGAWESNAVPCPTRSPISAQTDMEPNKFVVFLRERKQG